MGEKAYQPLYVLARRKGGHYEIAKWGPDGWIDTFDEAIDAKNDSRHHFRDDVIVIDIGSIVDRSLLKDGYLEVPKEAQRETEGESTH